MGLKEQREHREQVQAIERAGETIASAIRDAGQLIAEVIADLVEQDRKESDRG